MFAIRNVVAIIVAIAIVDVIVGVIIAIGIVNYYYTLLLLDL